MEATAVATTERADDAPTPTKVVGWDSVVQVLATVVTGAGLLGFVALFGGAILFARAERFDLPAAQAVALRPKSELLATGGQFLVAAMLIALGAIVVLGLLLRFVSSSSSLLFIARYQRKLKRERDAANANRKERLEARNHAQSEVGAADAELEKAREAYRVAHEEAERAQAELTTSAQLAVDAASEAAPFAGRLDELTGAKRVEAKSALNARDDAAEQEGVASEDLDEARRAEAETERKRDEAESGAAEAAAKLVECDERLAEATGAVDKIDEGQQRNVETRVRISRYAMLGLTLLLAELLLLALGKGIGVGHWVILVLVSVITSTMAVLVYHHTGKFVWFGVSAFLAIGVFYGWVLNYSIQDDPKIEPAAALVTGQTPVTGAYVTQTEDRVYLAIQRGGPESYDLLALPRADVVRLAVGPLTPSKGVAAAAQQMADQLCAQRPAAPDAKYPAPRC
jgi:hypothetical protein